MAAIRCEALFITNKTETKKNEQSNSRPNAQGSFLT